MLDDPHAPPLRGPDCAVAVIGAGNMGGAMVARLCEQGWDVVVCDIDPVRQRQALAVGAALSDDPAQAARRLAPDGVLLICVVDAAQTEAVLWGANGAAPVLCPGQTVMFCPTIAPDAVESMGLAERGLEVIDAPLSGGPARARDGSMSLMLAAKPALLARHERLLNALSDRRFVVGERVGDGARTKLVNNLLAGINLVGAAEALALAERLGLDVLRTWDVIEASSGQSWIGSDRMRRALAGDIEPRAHLSLLGKDTGLAMAMADAAGFRGPLGAAATAVFQRALALGMAAEDDSALLHVLRRTDETS